ncbi:hypothetical protein SteCoe_14535 [Stentor coeruleus]|uniref:PHD-type domain-containing protein n=1 Tax=Stentor coeruleus TaxID=5963 RepID=A0A1R2C5Y1_9CILI|nr:hypothetical protein SteCoe_14535 [Stentor coeruleus]
MYCSPRTKKKRMGSSTTRYKQKLLTDIPLLTTEPKEVFPFITYPDAAFCIFCKRPTAPLIKLPSGIFINLTGYAHEICLKNKGCCECGVLGLCYRCTVKDCSRLIHSWCAQALHGNANFCDLHSNTQKKKESSRLPFIKSICRKVTSSPFWEKDYKDKDSAASLCNGHIFWYLINLEYFPPGFDLSIFPTFPPCSYFDLKYDSSNESTNFVSSQLGKLSHDLEKIQTSNSKQIEGLLKILNKKKSSFSNQNYDYIGKSFDPVNDEYLNLMESKSKPIEDTPNSLAGLRKHLNAQNVDTEDKTEVQDLCVVCAEDDFDEIVVVCKKCMMIVHPKCYKTLQNEDFVCDVCMMYSFNVEIPCVLCPKRGGALKQTVHMVKDLMFPNYPGVRVKTKREQKSFIWVHAFCALHTPGVAFRNCAVDLSGIDTSKLNLQCDICKSKEGACLQCSFNRCSASFHAECGKDLFVSTKSNEKKIYCALHKPLKLRKMLEMRHKKVSEDIYKFCKAIEKYLNRTKTPAKVFKRKKVNKIRNSVGKIFSPDEDLLLEYRIQQFLYRLNLSQNKPFSISVNLQAATRSSRVSIERPQFYTMIVPAVIVEEGITIEGRNSEECFKRYQDTLYSKLKNEMLLLGLRLCIYQGKELPPTKHYTRHKKKPIEYNPLVSSDTYCICNQPYYYEIPWMTEWTQEQWEEKIRENEMIECTKCEKWYHLKCVKYEGNLDKAQQDENWKCGICDKKKQEKAKYLDQKSIISDLNQGVVTRRGTKIH